jgi:hypothetical protein
MAAADTLVLPIQRIDWPSVKMRFEARAAGKNFLQFLDDSYQYVQEPVEAASFQEHEAHRKDQLFVLEKQQVAWEHLFNLCQGQYMYILQEHQSKAFSSRVKDTWAAIIAEMEGSSDSLTPSDVFTQALETKMLDSGNVRVDFKNFIAQITEYSALAEKLKCPFSDGFKLALVKRGLSPDLDLSQNMAAINGSKTYAAFVKSISTSIESTYSLPGKRKRSSLENKRAQAENEQNDVKALVSSIQSVLEDEDDDANPAELLELIQAHYLKKGGGKSNSPFHGNCYDCGKRGHRRGDPQCPKKNGFKGSSKQNSNAHSDESSSSGSSLSIDSTSSNPTTYVINIPHNYSGTPLFTLPSMPTQTPSLADQPSSKPGISLVQWTPSFEPSRSSFSDTRFDMPKKQSTVDSEAGAFYGNTTKKIGNGLDLNYARSLIGGPPYTGGP